MTENFLKNLFIMLAFSIIVPLLTALLMLFVYFRPNETVMDDIENPSKEKYSEVSFP